MSSANDPSGGKRAGHCEGLRCVSAIVQTWCRWMHPKFPQIVICPVNIGPHGIQKLEIHAKRNRNIIVVLYPMRKIDRDVDAISRHHPVRDRPVLVLRPINWRIVVDGPEAFDLFSGQHIPVVTIEDVKSLAATNLKQDIAFTINMVRRHTIRRGNENQNVLLSYRSINVTSSE